MTLATYSFFAVALIARQYIDGKEKQFQLQIDIYIPVFTLLQFFFFMGLLKVLTTFPITRKMINCQNNNYTSIGSGTIN